MSEQQAFDQEDGEHDSSSESSSSVPSSSSTGGDNDSDSDSDSVSNNDKPDESDEQDNDTDLGTQLEKRKSGVGDQHAITRTPGTTSLRRRKKAGARKEAALSLASERLAAFRREKKQQGKQKKESRGYHSESDGSDNDAGNTGNKTDMNSKTANKREGAAQAKKKKSKHAPTEASSRRSDYYQRGAPRLNSSGIGVEVGANRYRARDPRIENMSGRYDAEVFERRYAFLDEMRDAEMDRLHKRIAARKATGRAGQKMRRKLGLTGGGGNADAGGTLDDDRAELARLKQERADRKRSEAQRSAQRAVRKRIRDEITDGKRGAYHVKRSELRRMELEVRFEDLRTRGGTAAVEKELARKRKRQESKGKRYLPT